MSFAHDGLADLREKLMASENYCHRCGLKLERIQTHRAAWRWCPGCELVRPEA